MFTSSEKHKDIFRKLSPFSSIYFLIVRETQDLPVSFPLSSPPFFSSLETQLIFIRFSHSLLPFLPSVRHLKTQDFPVSSPSLSSVSYFFIISPHVLSCIFFYHLQNPRRSCKLPSLSSLPSFKSFQYPRPFCKLSLFSSPPVTPSLPLLPSPVSNPFPQVSEAAPRLHGVLPSHRPPHERPPLVPAAGPGQLYVCHGRPLTPGLHAAGMDRCGVVVVEAEGY